MPGNKRYTIEFLKKVVEEDIPSLNSSAVAHIRRAIEDRLEIDPISFGKPLRYTLKGYRRIRVSDYRIVYRIEERKVLITVIQHRKDVYSDF